MKRRIIFIIAVLLILIGLFLLLRIAAATLSPKGKGALQITTNIKAEVFLDGQLIGQTPLCKCTQDQTIDVGEYEVKVVPQDKSQTTFTAKIRIEPGVLTAVERTFLPGGLSSSYVLTLEKIDEETPQLFVGSLPEGALVTIDSVSSGATPLSINDISASEHEIEIQKEGFSKKTIKIRAVPGYKLVANVILGTEANIPEASPTPTPTPTEAEEQKETKEIRILSTPNGFLRVRSGPSTANPEVTRVKTGDTFTVLDEQNGWYQIEIDGEEGWVSGDYAEEIN